MCSMCQGSAECDCTGGTVLAVCACERGRICPVCEHAAGDKTQGDLGQQLALLSSEITFDELE